MIHSRALGFVSAGFGGGEMSYRRVSQVAGDSLFYRCPHFVEGASIAFIARTGSKHALGKSCFPVDIQDDLFEGDYTRLHRKGNAAAPSPCRGSVAGFDQKLDYLRQILSRSTYILRKIGDWFCTAVCKFAKNED